MLYAWRQQSAVDELINMATSTPPAALPLEQAGQSAVDELINLATSAPPAARPVAQALEQFPNPDADIVEGLRLPVYSSEPPGASHGVITGAFPADRLPAESRNHVQHGFPEGAGVHLHRLGGRDRGAGPRAAVPLASREVIAGALNGHYDIPECTLVRRNRRGLLFSVVLLAVMVARFGLFVRGYPTYWPLELVWILPLASMCVQWVLCWRDRPADPPPAVAARLARLHVTVSIPCYNEDPGLLDRCLYALVNQTRPPQRIDVVDDGSKIDYTRLRDYWEGTWCGVDIRWVRQTNAGKKAAQGITFASAPEADIFIIIDSDTCLDARAIEQGLLPFADRGVASVAGIELAMNARKNWLTRTVSVRSMFFQMLPCAAQSAVGDVLINRGAYFLIRAGVVREYLDAYLNETFLGHRIKLGDDAALTLFARASGRTVQQSTAFGLTMYPETLSHHLRQWIRWMRGSTIRTCWRLRYLSPRTFGWWFTVLGVYSFLVSTAFPVMLVLLLPKSARAIEYVLFVTIAWAYIYGLRAFSVRRSDESRWFQAGSLFAYPAVLLWGLFVLRPLRLYGTVTFLNQGWTTRTKGAEVALALFEQEELVLAEQEELVPAWGTA